MTIRIRPAHTDELGRVGDITAAAYTHDGHVAEDDHYVEHLRDAATREREAELYVALVDDVLAGTVTFCPEGSRWREIGREGEGEFRMLAVAPNHRRQGVAQALVGLCLERSRELGYDAVVLSSLESQAPAQRIYERLGFVRVPDRDWEPVPGVALMGFRAVL
jgi:ribosomal protein S18 acetylase RimI-like enzyme